MLDRLFDLRVHGVVEVDQFRAGQPIIVDGGVKPPFLVGPDRTAEDVGTGRDRLADLWPVLLVNPPGLQGDFDLAGFRAFDFDCHGTSFVVERDYRILTR
ncbi:MAG: hypothetical protein QG659_71 [Patescibacteria group bacterium]|nr:hypothetical protein [Patescibacteria group bacterium]